MNHPSSKCIQFFEELVQISEASQTRPRARQRSTSKSTGVRADGDVEMVSFNLPAGHDQDRDSPFIADDFPSDIPAHHSQFKDHHIEVYPGAARTYGRGPTFMDEFDGDEHAAMREQNLYYPWASRPEWELASFLLRSSLSMAAVDQFLSLDLVSRFTSFNHYI